MTEVTYLGNAKTFRSNDLDHNWTAILDTKPPPVDTKKESEGGVSPATKTNSRGKRRRSQISTSKSTQRSNRSGGNSATPGKDATKGATPAHKSGGRNDATKKKPQKKDATKKADQTPAPANEAASDGEAAAPAYVVCSKDHTEILGLIEDRDFETLHCLAKEAFDNVASITTPAGTLPQLTLLACNINLTRTHMLITCIHDTCPRRFPRCMSTMLSTIRVHDVCPRFVSTMCVHDACPRCIPRRVQVTRLIGVTF